MGRMPSEKTQLVSAKRELNRMREELLSTQARVSQYHKRLTEAERELVEWKRRFDELLKIRVDLPRPTTPQEAPK